MSEAIVKLRRPWLAGLLSLFFIWFGPLYNRQPGRAAVAFLVDLAFRTSLVMIGFMSIPPFGLMGAIFVFLIVWRICIAADSFHRARKLGAISLARYNRGHIYIGLIVAELVVSALVVKVFPEAMPQNRALSNRAHVGGFRQTVIFSIPAESSFPSLQSGDRIVTAAVSRNELARGDLVIFRRSSDGVNFVKRIVGLPGERVRMRGGKVLINDIELHLLEVPGEKPKGDYPNGRTFVETTPEGKRYKVFDLSENGPLDNTPEQTVPAGHYWVLGDNRDNSSDSRVASQIGFVAANSIHRKVTFILWSRDFSRIGTAVE